MGSTLDLILKKDLITFSFETEQVDLSIQKFIPPRFSIIFSKS